jgi:hypothetical protein
MVSDSEDQEVGKIMSRNIVQGFSKVSIKSVKSYSLREAQGRIMAVLEEGIYWI